MRFVLLAAALIAASSAASAAALSQLLADSNSQALPEVAAPPATTPPPSAPDIASKDVLQLEDGLRNFPDLLEKSRPDLKGQMISQCAVDEVSAAIAKNPEIKEHLRILLEEARRSKQLTNLNPKPTLFTIQVLTALAVSGAVKDYDQQEHLRLLADFLSALDEIRQADANKNIPSCQQLEKDPVSAKLFQAEPDTAAQILLMSTIKGVEQALGR